uniref:Uncharacterized protein n=1 Tax=Rousettus aegyptiacus TaxID=9407 RepID=A0A7J8BAF6_ROUAE|nr:hypothetical protein HJG63_009991 [Rousettus aegyptiacus]
MEAEGAAGCQNRRVEGRGSGTFARPRRITPEVACRLQRGRRALASGRSAACCCSHVIGLRSPSNDTDRHHELRGHPREVVFLSLSERVTQIQSKENRRIQITGHSTDNWLRLFEKVHVTKEKKKRQERQFWNSAVQQKYNVSHICN